MKASHRTASTLLGFVLTAFLGTVAHAQGGLTREQVKAQLTEAQRTGNIIAGGESGLTQRELNPYRYSAAPALTNTRAQVVRELAEATRNGDLLAAGDSGLRLNELNARAYPAQPVAQGKSRTQVQAELREALRTGDILAGGELALPRNQLSPAHYANIDPAPMQMGAASGPMLR